MSDKIPFIIIVTEGVHDVYALTRILKTKGFREIQVISELPKELLSLIPRHYPILKNLNHFIPHPTFLVRDNKYVVVSNANGKTQLGENLSNLISVLSTGILYGLKGVAIVADMDQETKDNHQIDIINQISNEDPTIEISLESNNKLLRKDGFVFPLNLFFLPDNESLGTLESLLLLGAEKRYPDLYSAANEYIEVAKKNYSNNLNGFYKMKATVGVISNVLKPGKANQISIGEDEWFTEESLRTISAHIKLNSFIDSLCVLLDNN